MARCKRKAFSLLQEWSCICATFFGTCEEKKYVHVIDSLTLTLAYPFLDQDWCSLLEYLPSLPRNSLPFYFSAFFVSISTAASVFKLNRLHHHPLSLARSYQTWPKFDISLLHFKSGQGGDRPYRPGQGQARRCRPQSSTRARKRRRWRWGRGSRRSGPTSTWRTWRRPSPPCSSSQLRKEGGTLRLRPATPNRPNIDFVTTVKASHPGKKGKKNLEIWNAGFKFSVPHSLLILDDWCHFDMFSGLKRIDLIGTYNINPQF